MRAVKENPSSVPFTHLPSRPLTGKVPGPQLSEDRVASVASSRTNVEMKANLKLTQVSRDGPAQPLLSRSLSMREYKTFIAPVQDTANL